MAIHQSQKIKSEEKGVFKRFTTKNQGQVQGKERDDYETGESPIHYDIKVYVVRHLVQRLRDRGEDIDEPKNLEQWIETETKHDDVIPDVLFSQQQHKEAYEVETLFGTGPEPTKKIDRTIDKYDEHNVDVDEIHIVVENFTFLRHLDELRNIQQYYSHHNSEEGKPLIKFETLDFRNDGLLSLNAVIDEVREFEGPNNL